MLGNSTLGSRKLLSEPGFELVMLPDIELTPRGLRGMVLWAVDWESFGRGLVPDLTPRILDVCVRLEKDENGFLKQI